MNYTNQSLKYADKVRDQTDFGHFRSQYLSGAMPSNEIKKAQKVIHAVNPIAPIQEEKKQIVTANVDLSGTNNLIDKTNTILTSIFKILKLANEKASNPFDLKMRSSFANRSSDNKDAFSFRMNLSSASFNIYAKSSLIIYSRFRHYPIQHLNVVFLAHIYELLRNNFIDNMSDKHGIDLRKSIKILPTSFDII